MSHKENSRFRLYVPKGLQVLVLEQHHEMGHVSVEKFFDLISQNYCWSGLYKIIMAYVGSCITCQARIGKDKSIPLGETNITSYPFEKISIAVSRLYTETPRNLYTASFMDRFTNWVDAYAVMDKTVINLLMNEIFLRFGASLKLVTDNGLKQLFPNGVAYIIRESEEDSR